MAGLNMTKEKYEKLTRVEKRVYWAIVVVTTAFIGYMLLFYRS